MTLKERIDQDLKAALLSSDKNKVSVLRSLKSAILYEEVAKGLRETGLGDADITQVLAKEAKKRQESADLYKQGNDEARANQELDEKSIIETYLPEQLSEEELKALIDKEVQKLDNPGPQNMGQVIGSVKATAVGAADGATIARLVKERLGA